MKRKLLWSVYGVRDVDHEAALLAGKNAKRKCISKPYESSDEASDALRFYANAGYVRLECRSYYA